MKRCMIYIDPENIKSAMDLREVARRIYGDACETIAVSVNQTYGEVKGAFDQFIHVEEEKVFQSDAMMVTDVLEELHETYAFDCILIPATHQGRMLAPRLAMRLHVGLVADVTDIQYQGDQLEMIRPAFSGKIMAAIKQMGEGPLMMSVRPNVFQYEDAREKETKIIAFKPRKVRDQGLKLLETKEKPQTYDIRDSEVLISGGGGMLKQFDQLSTLADYLGGHVSASRKVIDKGVASRRIQVGQSGKTVSPKLYIALGINGAIQHVEGLKNVEHIISVNTNKDAPICSLSDLVVEGDALEFVERITEKIRQSNVSKP